MTYALPWRYSTTELKRQFKKLLKTNINRVCDKKDTIVNLAFINYKINYEFTLIFENSKLFYLLLYKIFIKIFL